jgi:malonate-semialdehyde dehydrogenase (acetylating)/methylmalonate-semialdehyde dehydrogenase
MVRVGTYADAVRLVNGNDYGTYSFGDWKNSRFGDTHLNGPDSIRFYTRGKIATTRWPDPSTSAIDLGFPQVD